MAKNKKEIVKGAIKAAKKVTSAKKSPVAAASAIFGKYKNLNK